MSAVSSQLVVRPTLAACAAGTLLGVTYTLSPMSVWFGLAMIVIFVWAGRGVTGRERLWLFRLLAVAVVLRVLVLIVFFLLTYRINTLSYDPLPDFREGFRKVDAFGGAAAVLMPDDMAVMRYSIWIRNAALGIPIAPLDYSSVFHLSGGESGQSYLLAYLQVHLGTATYGLRLVNLVLYLAAAIMLYRTVRPAFGAPAALAGLTVVLFLPSLFVWSISTLKEPTYLFFLALSLGGAGAALRANTRARRVLALIACAIGVLGMGSIRADGSLLVGGGLFIGVSFAALIRRPVLLLTLLVAFVGVGGYALRDPRVDDQARNLLKRGYIPHAGFVKSGGWNYRLLDSELYAIPNLNSTYQMTPGAAARYVIRAAASIVLVPLPWHMQSPFALAYLPEQVVWWVLVFLAAVGSVAGLRIDPRLTLLLLGVIFVSGAAIGLVSGNIGTMVRHRSTVLMPLAWLSGIGAYSLLTQAANRCSAMNPFHATSGT